MTRSDARVLFGLLGGGAAWSVHLLASYAVVALGCARGWEGARPTLVVLTLLAGALAIAAGVVAGRADTGVTDGDGVRFTLSLGGGLSALFAFLIVLGGVVPFLTPLCAVTR